MTIKSNFAFFIHRILRSSNLGHIKNKIHQFASKLWNINKSITGEGIGKTLSKVKGHLPILEIKLIPAIQCKKFT
jgi:aminopeptidase-like protein